MTALERPGQWAWVASLSEVDPLDQVYAEEGEG